MAHAGGAHLDHEELGVLGGTEDRQRDADLAVVGTDRGNGGAGGGQQFGQQVLGRGLARGTGDADDPQAVAFLEPGDDGRGDLAHGDDRVGHDDGRVHRAVGRSGFALGQGQQRTAVHGGLHKVVAVGGFAGLGHKEPALVALSRVGGDPEDLMVGRGRGSESPARDFGDFGGKKINHDR